MTVFSDFNIVCDSVHVYLTGLHYKSAALDTPAARLGYLQSYAWILSYFTPLDTHGYHRNLFGNATYIFCYIDTYMQNVKSQVILG